MSSRGMGRLSLVALITVMAGACEVEPYCLVCPDASDESFDAGEALDAGSERDGGNGDGSLDSSALADGCASGETCNSMDDDCDGEVDENIDTTSSVEHCGGCGNLCAPIHAFGACVESRCEIESCDVGFLDLDGEPETGCEYSCIAVASDDTTCDLKDDDCDGTIDENVDLQSDPENCGSCRRVCATPRAASSCVSGECALGACDVGYHNMDGVDDNGCEYACTPTESATETCNLRDDDCDGTVDEGNPGSGVACGSDEGECSPGTTSCVSGEIVCMGATRPTTELCNGLDDDCDGIIDQGDPEGGRVCGTSTGACEVGREQCISGALVCVGLTEPGIESCNNVDDDCDGIVDEMNPGGGAACGSAEGLCEEGVVTCTRGALLCIGGVGPGQELCNGQDDDCDGATDEGNPEAGQLCGTDQGRCAPGVRQCQAGVVTCIGEIGPIAETCDGVDEDCDGQVDEGNPGGGAACGSIVGECDAGALVCRTGILVCEGGTGPRAEQCNRADDDCDGRSDEGFSLDSDVNHCGGCGGVCAPLNAFPVCASGRCEIAACRSGFIDLDGVADNGCEYTCSYAGAERCNGRDDDCDGRTDESLTAPAAFCNPNGVCAGTVATCGGNSGWVCNYPLTYQETENRCDSLDNDCDGRSDESFPLVNTSCSNGTGACRRVGTFVCADSEAEVVCTAPPAGVPADEECNGADDDCDGIADETGSDNPLTAWRDAIDESAIPHVTYTSDGRTVRMMRYEASRPDASAASAGSLSTLACSRPNVMPWTQVSWAEAEAACCALNEGGTCAGAGGWRLCEAEDWETACEGPDGSCEHSYATSCSTSQPSTCNGMEHDCDPAVAGDQDCLYTTGSSSFAACFTDWATAGRIYDLSGNVREWTSSAAGTGIYQVRGGSYQSIEAGRACDFDFTVAAASFRAPTTGFRCCMY